MSAVDAIAFVGGNLAAMVIAMALATNAVPPQFSVALRIAAAIAAYVLIVSLLTLVLGCLGLLNAHLAAGLLIAPAIAAAFQLRRLQNRDHSPLLIEPKRFLEWSPLLPVILGLGAWWLARNLGLGTYITNDDKTYHAAIIAQWLRDGQFSIVGTTYQAYFPLNGELLSLWFMLPFGHDGAVPLNGVVYVCLFIALSIHFADRLGMSERWLLLPALLVLASTPTFFGITSFTDLDFSPPVMVLAAVAFLLASLEDSGKNIRWPLALLGGACAGFAVGMKVSFAPPIGLLCMIFAITAARRCTFGKAMAACTLVAIAVLGAGSYWYLRNWILTGNPVYPAAAGPFSGPFEAFDQTPTKLTSVLADGLGEEETQQIFEGFVNRPYAIAVVVIAGLIAGLAFLFRRKKLSADQRLLVLTLLVCTGAATAFFPITPFSGTNEVGGLESTGRYLNLLYLCGGLLSVLLLRGRKWKSLDRFAGRSVAFFLLLLVFTVPFSLSFGTTIAVGIIGLSVAAFLGLEFVSRLPGFRIPLFRTIPFLLPLLALATVPLNLHSTDRVALENPLLAELEKLPDDSRIAQFNGWLYQGYALAGRRQQHQPIRLLGNGERYQPMHLRPADDRDIKTQTFWDYERHHREAGPGANSLVDNLRGAGLDFLITSPHPETREWPPQYSLLENSREFAEIARGEDYVIWDIRDPGVTTDEASPSSTLTPENPQ